MMFINNNITAPLINYAVRTATDKALVVCDPLISKVSEVARKYLPTACLTVSQLQKNSSELIAQSENAIQEYSKMTGKNADYLRMDLYELAEKGSYEELKNTLSSMVNYNTENRAAYKAFLEKRNEAKALLKKVRELPREKIFRAIEDMADEGCKVCAGVILRAYINDAKYFRQAPEYTYSFSEHARPEEIQISDIDVLRNILDRCRPQTPSTEAAGISVRTTPDSESKIDLS